MSFRSIVELSRARYTPCGTKFAQNPVNGSLREKVMNGRISPGMRIVERELTELLNISRMPVRDALVDLERKGQIVNRGNGRCVINLEGFDG